MKLEILTHYQTVAKFTLDNTRYKIQVHQSAEDDYQVIFSENMIQVTNTIVNSELSVRLREKKTDSGERFYSTLVLSDNAQQEDKDTIAAAIKAGYDAYMNDATTPDAPSALVALFAQGKIMTGAEIKASVLTQVIRTLS